MRIEGKIKIFSGEEKIIEIEKGSKPVIRCFRFTLFLLLRKLLGDSAELRYQ
ncbi:MAG: hypothetical protein PWR13_128 [Archaeoglobi archaeon]|nr:hypothetical protein [Candidatus Mnemosynella bozhongmuii]MDI3502101.1 hypothetical protein [Archaeoglobi archaeon]MDK2781100.1 hypothetical protein [Archaeoglobi archaeon]